METELIDPNLSLLEHSSPNATLKKSNSLLEYIINHRQDILEKVELERQNVSNGSPKRPVPENEIRELEKKVEYINTIRWFVIFALYGFIGGILINAVSNVILINYDMIFNLLISPIIYYHSPRNILCNISIQDFIKYYSCFFLFGLGFRFLDLLPGFNEFALDPTNIKTPTQIGLCIFVCVLLFLLSVYFIIISSELKLTGYEYNFLFIIQRLPGLAFSFLPERS